MACLIDSVVLYLGGCVLGFILGFMLAAGGFPEDFVLIVVFLAGLALNWLYAALLESSAAGATLGKMAIRIRVTDREGRRVSFGRASGRHFGKYLSGLILGIGFLEAGFTKKKQALHDSLADCLVMRND